VVNRGIKASPLALFLFEAEERIVNEVTKRLRQSALEHYRQMETIDLRPRVQADFDAYRESALAGDAEPFCSYLADIGGKRLQQGYRLGELLFALDTLFAVVWETAAAAWRERGAQAFDDLRRLADGISRGKGRLATLYEEKAKKERAALGKLSAAFDEYLRLRKAYRDEGQENRKGGTT
jgi:predicted DNA-binding transcriptional regulator YafY